MAKPRVPPTAPQLEYLDILGWRGAQPQTMREASDLIDRLKLQKKKRGCLSRATGCFALIGLAVVAAIVIVVAGVILSR